MEVEAVRAQFRRAKVTTLFVGESAPHSPNFFYLGNTAMFRHMQRVAENAFGGADNFLHRFKSWGWYLDDLVLSPVNHLPAAHRHKMCSEGVPGLGQRIADYQPEAIVTLLFAMKPYVDNAIAVAGWQGTHYVVPFPGMGHQLRFHTEMARIITKLPRLG